MYDRFVKVIRVEKNFLGCLRGICKNCSRYEDCKGGMWKVVVRKGKKGGELWGIECEYRGVRVI